MVDAREKFGNVALQDVFVFARELLTAALKTYRGEHKTQPARVVLCKTSSFSAQERDGFHDALDTLDIEAADLLNMEGMNDALAYELASRGIITMENLAEQAVDDLLEIEGMDRERAGTLIMTARRPWFETEAAASEGASDA